MKYIQYRVQDIAAEAFCSDLEECRFQGQGSG